MILTTELLDDVSDVDAATINEVLRAGRFGAYAILAVSDQEYLQAGNDGQPDDECRSSQVRREPDLWILEFREDGRQFQAAGRATLEQVRRTFLSYLAREQEWRSEFTWTELGS